MNRRIAGGLVVLIIVVAGAGATSPATAVRWLSWLVADPLRFGVALTVIATIRPFFSWPTTLLAVAAGYGFGWVGGVVGGAVLITVTALPPYYLADQVSTGRVYDAGRKVIDETGGARAVFGSRLLPLPSDAISVAAGISGVKLRSFLVGTFVGELPWVVLGVAVGVSGDSLVVGDTSALDPAVLVPMAAGGILILAGPGYRLLREFRTSTR